jgi:plasmid stabilization system protein ParE
MKVKWTQHAVEQLDALVDNLAERASPAVAQRVAGRLLDGVGRLAELPRSAPVWRPAADPDFRRLVVDAYVVLYRIAESEQLVYVLAVRHGRQRPPQPSDVPDE